MSYALAKARYADATTQTVSPVRLLTMLYDRLVSDLATAEDAMRRNEYALVGDRLGRAQEILLELRSSLDTEIWPEGEPLGALYLWLVGELNQARLRHSPERVAACRELVEPLRDAWQAAALQAGPDETAGGPTDSGNPAMPGGPASLRSPVSAGSQPVAALMAALGGVA